MNARHALTSPPLIPPRNPPAAIARRKRAAGVDAKQQMKLGFGFTSR
jgi:hypothetical protein